MMVTTIRCPTCGTLSNQGVNFCPNCDTFLPWTDVVARPRPTAAIELSVAATRAAMNAGEEATVDLTIRNTGRNVDRVDFDIEGIHGGWSVVEPGTVNLLPDESAVARLMVRPPRDASVPAGTHLLVIHARSTIDPSVDAEQRVTVEVAPFDDLRVRMTPPTSRGTTEAVYRVVVENAGNHPVSVTLDGRDRDGAGDLSVTVDPSVVHLQGGAGSAATATVRPARPITDGAARPRPFQLVAQADGHAETVLDGVMIHEPVPAPAPKPQVQAPPEPPPRLLPPVGELRRPRRWWPIVLALLLALGAAGAAAAAKFAPDLLDNGGGGQQGQAPQGVEQQPGGEQSQDGKQQPAGEQSQAGEHQPAGEQPASLPDFTLTALQCALVPEAGELRFAVQVANQGGAFGDAVTVSATAGDRRGATDISIDGVGTGEFVVPIDAELLGTTIDFTIAVDPGNDVEEAAEGNNVGDVTINLPPTADQPVSLCG
jgi:hypothetical protein